MFCPFEYKYKIVRSGREGDANNLFSGFLDEISACIGSWEKEFLPLRINLFFKVSENINCEMLSRKIEESGFYEKVPIQPILIAQSPTDGSVFQASVGGVKRSAGLKVSYELFESSKYTKIVLADQKWIFFGASSCYSENRIPESSNNAFSQIASILKKEGLSFSNILRQWNYIPDIVGLDIFNGKSIQHYQEFNEARGKWYSEGGLIQDFPAATGIGTNGQVVRLEIIAADPGDDLEIYSLQNPDQKDAHRYSQEKLVGTIRETKPLFERGKMVVGNDKAYVWVSGTAAIKGEESISGSTLEQTRVTCENISHLIGEPNLRKAGLPFINFKMEPVYCRAYVKFAQDGLAVKKYMEDYYPGAETHVLEADVCRDELLVEIEAEFIVRKLGD